VFRLLSELTGDAGYSLYRVVDEHGEYADSDLVRAIVYAADDGVDVLNLSLGNDHVSDPGYNCSPRGATCAVHDAVQYAKDQGTLVVAAAGNAPRANATCCPALSEAAICVGGCVARCTANREPDRERTVSGRPPGAIWIRRGDGEGVSGQFCSTTGCSPTNSCEANREIEPWRGNPRFVNDTPDTLAPAYFPQRAESGAILNAGSSFSVPIVAAGFTNLVGLARLGGEAVDHDDVEPVVRTSGQSLDDVPVGVFDWKELAITLLSPDESAFDEPFDRD
jgi:hypothetical protein